MKRFFFAILIIFLLAATCTRHLISAVYLIRGEGVEHSVEMGKHGEKLLFTNIKHLSLYVREFFGGPEFSPHDISPLFFGLNVAPPKKRSDYRKVISDLRLLGVKSLRIDIGFGYGSNIPDAEEFIEAVLPDFDVLLHVVQHPKIAASMNTGKLNERWRKFLDSVMSRYQGRINTMEIGSMPNRKKWSGYTVEDYLQAVRIAFELSGKYGIKIAGPNIQDFEPFWQIVFFESVRQEGYQFSVSTDNLFVDRAIQPELFDTHVFGKKLADTGQMDLLNKSRILSDISGEFGIEKFYSTYTQWNLNVPAPYYFASSERLAVPETYADYLVRYYLLAAAGGYIDRVYWGEYASYKEGLIDDGYNPAEEDRPFPDSHHKFKGFGDVDKYRKRSAFHAYRTMVSFIEGSSFVSLTDTPGKVRVLRFDRGKSRIFALWSLDGTHPKFSINGLLQCNLFGRDGDVLKMPDGAFLELSQKPQYLVCN